MDFKHKKLYLIRLDILKNILIILFSHGFSCLNANYTVIYDVFEKAVDNALKEVDVLWTD